MKIIHGSEEKTNFDAREKATDMKICYNYRSKVVSNRLIRFEKNLFHFKEYTIYKGIFFFPDSHFHDFY